ncbi:MAG: DNA-3-methyladenine glycosylase I [Defluviitaleaceae bacterium]|nr:DNA-3-methyladenine glycosylase I [Defluviitaleaceae bacterium]
MSEKIRCFWAETSPLFYDYHDNEWGRPVHDDNKLFEMLTLEGAQAGLSWLTVLKKRENYREAFDGFDPKKVALYDELKVQKLMSNEGIIRNRLKIQAAITNASLFLETAKKYGSFDKFIWSYVDNMPIVNHPKKPEDIPATTPLSNKISKDLKKIGFKFVGSTIMYAFMQATGIVNDHTVECHVYQEMPSIGVASL